MRTYSIVAFYQEEKSEVAVHAEAISAYYHLQLRYEKIPRTEVSLLALLTPDTVLCILERTTFSFRKLMRYVYALNKPVIVVHRNDSPQVYHQLKVPVGYLQENKEKVVWANFFQHNNPACTLELVIPKEKDSDIALMVNNNVAFIENIFRKSGADYKKTFVEGSFEKNLKKIFHDSDDCVILLMRPFRIFSFHLPCNIRIFRKYAHTPTMIIPRDDALYIPCH